MQRLFGVKKLSDGNDNEGKTPESTPAVTPQIVSTSANINGAPSADQRFLSELALILSEEEEAKKRNEAERWHQEQQQMENENVLKAPVEDIKAFSSLFASDQQEVSPAASTGSTDEVQKERKESGKSSEEEASDTGLSSKHDIIQSVSDAFLAVEQKFIGGATGQSVENGTHVKSSPGTVVTNAKDDQQYASVANGVDGNAEEETPLSCSFLESENDVPPVDDGSTVTSYDGPSRASETLSVDKSTVVPVKLGESDLRYQGENSIEGQVENDTEAGRISDTGPNDNIPHVNAEFQIQEQCSTPKSPKSRGNFLESEYSISLGHKTSADNHGDFSVILSTDCEASPQVLRSLVNGPPGSNTEGSGDQDFTSSVPLATTETKNEAGAPAAPSKRALDYEALDQLKDVPGIQSDFDAAPLTTGTSMGSVERNKVNDSIVAKQPRSKDWNVGECEPGVSPEQASEELSAVTGDFRTGTTNIAVTSETADTKRDNEKDSIGQLGQAPAFDYIAQEPVGKTGGDASPTSHPEEKGGDQPATMFGGEAIEITENNGQKEQSKDPAPMPHSTPEDQESKGGTAGVEQSKISIPQDGAKDTSTAADYVSADSSSTHLSVSFEHTSDSRLSPSEAALPEGPLYTSNRASGSTLEPLGASSSDLGDGDQQPEIKMQQDVNNTTDTARHASHVAANSTTDPSFTQYGEREETRKKGHAIQQTEVENHQDVMTDTSPGVITIALDAISARTNVGFNHVDDTVDDHGDGSFSVTCQSESIVLGPTILQDNTSGAGIVAEEALETQSISAEEREENDTNQQEPTLSQDTTPDASLEAVREARSYVFTMPSLADDRSNVSITLPRDITSPAASGSGASTTSIDGAFLSLGFAENWSTVAKAEEKHEDEAARDAKRTRDVAVVSNRSENESNPKDADNSAPDRKNAAIQHGRGGSAIAASEVEHTDDKREILEQEETHDSDARLAKTNMRSQGARQVVADCSGVLTSWGGIGLQVAPASMRVEPVTASGESGKPEIEENGPFPEAKDAESPDPLGKMDAFSFRGSPSRTTLRALHLRNDSSDDYLGDMKSSLQRLVTTTSSMANTLSEISGPVISTTAANARDISAPALAEASFLASSAAYAACDMVDVYLHRRNKQREAKALIVCFAPERREEPSLIHPDASIAKPSGSPDIASFPTQSSPAREGNTEQNQREKVFEDVFLSPNRSDIRKTTGINEQCPITSETQLDANVKEATGKCFHDPVLIAAMAGSESRKEHSIDWLDLPVARSDKREMTSIQRLRRFTASAGTTMALAARPALEEVRDVGVAIKSSMSGNSMREEEVLVVGNSVDTKPHRTGVDSRYVLRPAGLSFEKVPLDRLADTVAVAVQGKEDETSTDRSKATRNQGDRLGSQIMTTTSAAGTWLAQRDLPRTGFASISLVDNSRAFAPAFGESNVFQHFDPKSSETLFKPKDFLGFVTNQLQVHAASDGVTDLRHAADVCVFANKRRPSRSSSISSPDSPGILSIGSDFDDDDSDNNSLSTSSIETTKPLLISHPATLLWDMIDETSGLLSLSQNQGVSLPKETLVKPSSAISFDLDSPAIIVAEPIQSVSHMSRDSTSCLDERPALQVAKSADTVFDESDLMSVSGYISLPGSNNHDNGSIHRRHRSSRHNLGSPEESFIGNASFSGSRRGSLSLSRKSSSRRLSAYKKAPSSRRLQREGSVNLFPPLRAIESGETPKLRHSWSENNLMLPPENDIDPCTSCASGITPDLDTHSVEHAAGGTSMFELALTTFSSVVHSDILEYTRPSPVPDSIKYLASVRWRQLVAKWEHLTLAEALTEKTCSLHYKLQTIDEELSREEDEMTVSTGVVKRRGVVPDLLNFHNLHGVINSETKNLSGVDPHLADGDMAALGSFLLDFGVTFFVKATSDSIPQGKGQPENILPETTGKATADTLVKLAASNLKKFTFIIEDIVNFALHNRLSMSSHDKDHDVSYSVGIKSLESIEKKALRKYAGDVLQVKDALRGQITFPDEGSLACGLLRLVKRCKAAKDECDLIVEVVRVKNIFQRSPSGSICVSPLPTGYRHILITLRLNGLLLAEIQFQLAEMFEVLGFEGYYLHQEILELNEVCEATAGARKFMSNDKTIACKREVTAEKNKSPLETVSGKSGQSTISIKDSATTSEKGAIFGGQPASDNNTTGNLTLKEEDLGHRSRDFRNSAGSTSDCKVSEEKMVTKNDSPDIGNDTTREDVLRGTQRDTATEALSSVACLVSSDRRLLNDERAVSDVESLHIFEGLDRVAKLSDLKETVTRLTESQVLCAVRAHATKVLPTDPRNVATLHCLHYISMLEAGCAQLDLENCIRPNSGCGFKPKVRKHEPKEDVKVIKLDGDNQTSLLVSKECLLRTLTISNQGTSIGMNGWLEYGASTSFSRMASGPLFALRELSVTYASLDEWSKAVDSLQSLIMKCDQQQPLYHPTTLLAMLDLAGAASIVMQPELEQATLASVATRLALYLAEQEQRFFERLGTSLDERNQKLSVLEIDYGMEGIPMLQAFVESFESQLSLTLLERVGSATSKKSNYVFLASHLYLADALSVLANCIVAQESIIGASSFDRNTSRYYWRKAFEHYEIAYKGNIRNKRKMNDDSVVAAAYGIGRCLRELGQRGKALKILSSVVSVLSRQGLRIDNSEENALESGPSCEVSLCFLPFRYNSSTRLFTKIGLYRPRQEHSISLFLWLMAVCSVEEHQNERGRMRALSLLHAASETLREGIAKRGQNAEPETMTCPPTTGALSYHQACEKLLLRVEQEAKDLLEPLADAIAEAAPEMEQGGKVCQSQAWEDPNKASVMI